jgi:hypothetical protein
MICIYSGLKHYQNMKKIQIEIKKRYIFREIKKMILRELIYNVNLKNTIAKQKHYIIRVGDGDNFIRQPYKVWGLSNKYKRPINNINANDVIWWLTNKNNGGIIEVAEFKNCYNRNDDILGINTYTNTQQRWLGNKDWNIQMHYNTVQKIDDKKLNKIFLQGASSIWAYNTKLKDKIKNDFNINLYHEYAVIKTNQYFKRIY